MLTFEAPVADGQRCAPHCASLCTEAGLAEAYRIYAAAIAAFCRRSLTDPWLAEEIMQEVFVKAWRNCARFDDREGPAGDHLLHDRLRPWLFVIARNAVIDAVRRRGRHLTLVSGSELVDPFDGYTRFDDADLVRSGLETLSPAHSAALVAIFIEGLTYDQAAARLGIPSGTLKSRVFNALRALRSALGARRDARPAAS